MRIRYFFWIVPLFLLALPLINAAEGMNMSNQTGATSTCAYASTSAGFNCTKINDLNISSFMGNAISNQQLSASIFFNTNLINAYIANISILVKSVSGAESVNLRCLNASNGVYNTIGTWSLTTTASWYYFNNTNRGCSKLNLSAATTIADWEVYEILVLNGTNTTLPSSPNITATAIDLYDSTPLNFSLAIFRGNTVILNQSTTNGSIPVTNITNGMANLTFQSTQSGGYFEQRYFNVNISGQSFTGELYQAILYLNASQVITGTQITNFGATAPLQYNQSNSTGWTKLFLKAGSYNITGNTTGYLNTSTTVTVSALSESLSTLIFGTKQLKIAAKDIFTNVTVLNFNISLVGVNVSYSSTVQTTTGNASFSLIDGVYNATFTSATHAWYSQLITVTQQLQNETFYVYPINSILVRIYNLLTNALMVGTSVQGSFISAVSVFNLSTNNASILAETIIPSTYTIAVSSTGYTTREYFVTLTGGQNVVLNAYLSNSSTFADITFTLKDVITLNVLPNVEISVSKRINLSYVTIDQETTDIAGNAIFTLSQTESYRFTINTGGYQTKVFDLIPTLTAYTVTIDPSVTADWSTIYSSVYFTLLPSSLTIQPGITNFSIITSSVNGAVQDYFGLNTTYLGVLYKTNVSGSVAGGTASISINLTNSSSQYIPITYFIKVNGQDVYQINKVFYISNVNATNTTIVGFADNFKDVQSSGWLAIVAVFATILIMGTFWSLGITGNKLSVIAAMSMGVFTWFGFIHPNPIMNDIIGSIITITLLGGYFILTRIGD